MNTSNTTVNIIKANGEHEPFMPDKLIHSLSRAGASAEIIEEIVSKITEELRDGMTTRHIYDRAFSLLSNAKNKSAARYNLRNAVMQLGPSGFPFERFIAHIFTQMGYTTSVGNSIPGTCISHEVDVVAYNNSHLHMIEAKFHNEHGIKSDVRDTLYVKARFDDLSDHVFTDYGNRTLDQGWLITNTKFSSSAIQYGECAGLKLVGWNYPKQRNLQQLIEETGLQPITCLTSLSKKTKKTLLKNNIVLCRMIHTNEHELKRIDLTHEDIRQIKDEAQIICGV